MHYTRFTCFFRACSLHVQSASCRRADDHEWWRSSAAAGEQAAAGDAHALAASDTSRSLPASSIFAAAVAQAVLEPVATSRAVSFDPHVGVFGASAPAREPWVPPGRRRSSGGIGLGVGGAGTPAAAAAAAAALALQGGGAPATPRSALRATAAPFMLGGSLPPPSPRVGSGLGSGSGLGPGSLLPASPRLSGAPAGGVRPAACGAYLGTATGAHFGAALTVPPPSPRGAPANGQLQFLMSPLSASVAAGVLPPCAAAAEATGLLGGVSNAGGRADGAWEEEAGAACKPIRASLPVLLPGALLPARPPAAVAAAAAQPARPGTVVPDSAGGSGRAQEGPTLAVPATDPPATTPCDKAGHDKGDQVALSSATASLSSVGSAHSDCRTGSGSAAPAPRVGFSPATPLTSGSPPVLAGSLKAEVYMAGSPEGTPRARDPPVLRGFAAASPGAPRRRRAESHHNLVSLLSASLARPVGLWSGQSTAIGRPPASLPPLSMGGASRATGAHWLNTSSKANPIPSPQQPPRAAPGTPRQAAPGAPWASGRCSAADGRGQEAARAERDRGVMVGFSGSGEPAQAGGGCEAGGAAAGAGPEPGLAGGRPPAPGEAAAGGHAEAPGRAPAQALPEQLAAALRQLPPEVMAKLAGPYRCALRPHLVR